jgi:hypothetical protein
MRPALPSALMWSPAIGVPDITHLKLAPRASLVPFLADSASFGFPTFTVNRYPRSSITGSRYASFPALVESIKVEASGTSTFAKAGFGLFTVRAQSQAITVSFCPTYCFRSGRAFAISPVTSILG